MKNNPTLQTPHSTLVLPPEWAEQEAVQLTWPHAGTDWAYMLPEITDTYINMAAEIAKRERLIIVAPDADAMDDVLDRIFELAPGGDIMVVECRKYCIKVIGISIVKC